MGPNLSLFSFFCSSPKFGQKMGPNLRKIFFFCSSPNFGRKIRLILGRTISDSDLFKILDPPFSKSCVRPAQERRPTQALLAKANGRRPVGRPRIRWTDYIADLGWNRLGLRSSEMIDVMEDREVWRLNFELLPPQPSRKSGQ